MKQNKTGRTRNKDRNRSEGQQIMIRLNVKLKGARVDSKTDTHSNRHTHV